jgi:hypothetical protein
MGSSPEHKWLTESHHDALIFFEEECMDLKWKSSNVFYTFNLVFSCDLNMPCSALCGFQFL